MTGWRCAGRHSERSAHSIRAAGGAGTPFSAGLCLPGASMPGWHRRGGLLHDHDAWRKARLPAQLHLVTIWKAFWRQDHKRLRHLSVQVCGYA